MKNKLLLLGTFAMALFSCHAQTQDAKIRPFARPAIDSVAQTPTLVKVKKPWYAWRNLVVGKMRFNSDFSKKIHELVIEQKDEISDKIKFELQELYRDSPFQIKEELDALIHSLVK